MNYIYLKDFNPYDHFGFLTNRVARLISYEMQQSSADSMGFPSSCIGIMAELWQRDGLSQKELGTSLIKTKSSINKMLDALSQSGMIIKKPDEYDKRAKRVFLTAKGKSFQLYVQNKSRKSEQELLGELSPEDIAAAKRVLETLYHKLSEKRNKRLDNNQSETSPKVK